MSTSIWRSVLVIESLSISLYSHWRSPCGVDSGDWGDVVIFVNIGRGVLLSHSKTYYSRDDTNNILLLTEDLH